MTLHQTLSSQTLLSHSPLAKALLANALFSGTSALVIAFAHESLSHEIPLPSVYWLFIALGLGMFAGQLLLMATALVRPSPWQNVVFKLTPSVVIADVVWVLGSLTLALVFANQISGMGFGIIAGVNVFVGSLAALQYKGLQYRGLQNSPR
ncbi:MAG: hypothetical protein V7765_13485 [Oleispira sp.]